MKLLSFDLKAWLCEAVLKAFPDLEMAEVMKAVNMEEPRSAAHGDFASGFSMKLAKKVGKSPAEVAAKVQKMLAPNPAVERTEFAAPGFVNITLSEPRLQALVEELQTELRVSRASDLASSAHDERPVIVEYSSTNAAKHMGVHHIITTILGDALANLFEFLGDEVIRINHLGDWGTHFGKLIYAIEEWGDRSAIEAHPNDELTRLYVEFHNQAEKDPSLEEKARAIFKSLEDGDPERMALWKWIVEESVDELKTIFLRLGVEFDHITGESFYLKMADEVLADGIQKGIFVKGEGGALIAEMGEGQTPALVQKSDGTTLYLTRDLATVRYRVQHFHPREILYVVDHAQSLHFAQNFAVAKRLGYDVVDGANQALGTTPLATSSSAYVMPRTALEHISFGRMNFVGMSMSTRKGNVIKLTAILEEAAKRAEALAIEKGAKAGSEELRMMAELIGTASVKYAVLSQDRNKDLVFDWDRIISLEGNSAPYLLYSYARGLSILTKVGETATGRPEFTEEAERVLARKLVKFPEALEAAAVDRKPHIIATALYELCQDFNRFYGAVSVVNAENEIAKRTRTGLVQAFLNELRAGLQILGIPVLERM